MTSEVSLIPLKTDQFTGVASDELVAGHSILKSGVVGESEIGETVLCGDCSIGNRGSDLGRNLVRATLRRLEVGILMSPFTTKYGR